MSGALAGNVAINDTPTIFAWNYSPDDVSIPQLFAVQNVQVEDKPATPLIVWTLTFPGMTQWTSTITVLDNFLFGCTTTFQIGSDGSLIPIQSQLVAVDYRSGSPGTPPQILWQLPADADSDLDPTFGPDGAIYLPYTGGLTLEAEGNWTGGVRRYAPIYPGLSNHAAHGSDVKRVTPSDHLPTDAVTDVTQGRAELLARGAG